MCLLRNVFLNTQTLIRACFITMSSNSCFLCTQPIVSAEFSLPEGYGSACYTREYNVGIPCPNFPPETKTKKQAKAYKSKAQRWPTWCMLYSSVIETGCIMMTIALSPLTCFADNSGQRLIQKTLRNLQLWKPGLRRLRTCAVSCAEKFGLELSTKTSLHLYWAIYTTSGVWNHNVTKDQLE